MKINPVALANTLAIIDFVAHILFHIWVAISPESYESLMQLFVAGLRLEVDQAFELALPNVILGVVLEAAAFWILGFAGGSLYNRLTVK